MNELNSSTHITSSVGMHGVNETCCKRERRVLTAKDVGSWAPFQQCPGLLKTEQRETSYVHVRHGVWARR